MQVGGGKVKIREKERNEPPHVTILHGVDGWRVGLRDGAFLVPPGGSWRDIDEDVRRTIDGYWAVLQTAWDRMYPRNPIGGGDDDG